MKLSSGLMWGGGGLSLGVGLLALLQAFGILPALPGKGNSPIRIVGGTLKFRTDPKKLKWVAVLSSCTPPGGAKSGGACIVTDTPKPTTALSWSGTNADSSLPSLAAWDVVINFGGSTTNFVRIYPSDGSGVCTAMNNSCQASASGSVSAYAVPGQPGTSLYIWPDSLDDMLSSPHRKFRYVDPQSTNANAVGSATQANPYYVDDVVGFVVHYLPSGGATLLNASPTCGVAGSAGECEVDVP